MRRRLRNYVAVVMSILLCTCVWFQHVETVKAEGEQLATVHIVTDEKTLTLQDVAVNNFSVKQTEDGAVTYGGNVALTAEQIKAEDSDGRYLLYWYPTNDSDGAVATGNSPVIDLGMLYEISCEKVSGNDGSVTYNLELTVYATYGEEYYVTYYSNETQDGDHTADTFEQVFYYQADPDELGGTYNHPKTPTINGQVITNGNMFFVGWGTTDSGELDDIPSEFSYADSSSLTLYARWQSPCELTINYYMTEAEMQLQHPYYDPVTILQQNLEDTSFTFTTKPGAEMDGEFFAAWQYKDETGQAFTLAENETTTIPIPQDGSNVSLDLYGLWSPAAKLQVTYNQGDMGAPDTVEVVQESISDTTFTFVTSADVAPPSDFAIFEGWSYTNADGKTVMIGAGETCSDIPLTTTAVTLTAVWKEPLASGATVSAGTHMLLEGETYTLGSGSWTVTGSDGGDNCLYTGGREFYIPATGDYTFVAN